MLDSNLELKKGSLVVSLATWAKEFLGDLGCVMQLLTGWNGWNQLSYDLNDMMKKENKKGKVGC